MWLFKYSMFISVIIVYRNSEVRSKATATVEFSVKLLMFLDKSKRMKQRK